jgi:hypothetical protein
MSPPSWLAAVVAGAMLVIAGYCATRPVVARRWRRATHHDVDAKHVVMGVAMTGMLIPALNPLRAGAWEVIFAAAAAWFAGRMLRDRLRPDPAPAGRPPMGGVHHGAHMLSCVAMVCMLLAARSGGAGAGMAAGPGTGAMPAVALLLAVAVAASVVVTTDLIPAPRAAPPAPAPRGAAAGPAPDPGGARQMLCPRLAAFCQIVMGVAMAYMLILMV